MALSGNTPTGYSDHCTGVLAQRITAGQSTGITITADTYTTPAGTSPVTFPTGEMLLRISNKTRAGTSVEIVGAESASQSGATVTLGTTQRYMSQTDGTSWTSGGDGLSFPAGSVVELVWTTHHAENTAFKNNANTFSATQTVTAPLKVTGTSSYVGIPEMTTAQRNAITPTQSCFVYDTTLSQVYKWEGGAWVAVDSGTFSNASDHTAGKVDIASSTEIGAGTATDATSGATNVVPVSQTTKTSNGASDENKIPVLQSDGALHINHIATGTPDGTKFVRDDGVLATPPSTSTDYCKTVFSSATASATLSNPTSETNFDTYTYTIPANDLVAGVIYRFDITGSMNWGAGTYKMAIRLGSSGSDVAYTTITPVATGQHFRFTGYIMGTAAAGAAVAVKGAACLYSGTGSNAKFGQEVDLTAPTFATNGTLDIYFSAIFGTSNGSNSAYIDSGYITREFTTAS